MAEYGRKFLIIENRQITGILTIDNYSREIKIKITLSKCDASVDKIAIRAFDGDRLIKTAHMQAPSGRAGATAQTDIRLMEGADLTGLALTDDKTGTRLYEYGKIPDVTEESRDETEESAKAAPSLEATRKEKEAPREEEAEIAQTAGSALSELTAALDAHFSRVDPFGTKREDYIWWHVDSAVTLSDVLYRLGVRTALMYDPGVLTAYYKHSHMIFGVFKGHGGGADGHCRMMIGTPANYDPAALPVAKDARWAQLDGQTTARGRFGYWIILI